MAINEDIVTGRKFRKLLDEATKLWQRISFWTKASDVEFDDGQTAETKMGAIKGITTDLNVTKTGYAADATMLAQLYSEISEIQILRNNLAALDTRVTNAITGGDLVPPYTLDLSILSYKDSTHGQNSSITQSRMAIGADNQNGTGYIFRYYSNTFVVPKKGKIKTNFSRYAINEYATGIPLTVTLYIMDPSATHHSTNILNKNMNFNGTDSLDLSSIAGRTVKVVLGMVRSGGTIYNTAGITINSLVVTNQ